MRPMLPLFLVLLAASALLPAAEGGPVRLAVFADGTGAHLASFAYDGPCDGEGTVTLVIHRPAGEDVRVVPVTSSSPTSSCGAGLTCLDCPPVPTAYGWTLTNKAAGVLLAGGGPGAYHQYQDNPLAYSLSGPFQEGVLDAAGALW